MANLKTVGVVITGVTGVLAWLNSCKSCASIEDDDTTIDAQISINFYA